MIKPTKSTFITGLIVFLILNFITLGIGGLFTGPGVTSNWYLALNKVPWTPPGWVFGFAWTTIMICFSIYLAYLWPRVENRRMLIALYSVQVLLNFGWNPLFFYYHLVLPALACIIALTLLVGYFLFKYKSDVKAVSLLLFPYLIWLIIATSLNWYVLANI